MKHILVTGATGFLGRSLVRRLHGDGYRLSVSTRRPSDCFPPAVRTHVVDVASPGASWEGVLDGIDVVVHCAARVHIMEDKSVDPLCEFRKVNVEATLKLARDASRAGVRRFVFISSIKVNGEGTPAGVPYTANDAPRPTDAYGISKMEAEKALLELASNVDMDVVIIRPVLVYGPGVKANFLSMMRILVKGIPLPLGSVHNRRSLVALDNLCDLVCVCIEHPAAANQVFLVSDGEDLSTTMLLQRLARALGVSARLLPVPTWVLKSGAAVIGKSGVSQRLCGSLQVDISKTCLLLGWRPPISVDDALAATAQHYLDHSKQ